MRFLRETIAPAGGRVSWGELWTATRRLVVPPQGLHGYYWTMAVDSFTWGLILSLLFGMLVQTYGFTTFQLGIMSSLMALTWTLSQWPAGRLIDRFGGKPMMIVSLSCGIPIVLGLASASSFPAFAAIYACVGIMALGQLGSNAADRLRLPAFPSLEGAALYGCFRPSRNSPEGMVFCLLEAWERCTEDERRGR